MSRGHSTGYTHTQAYRERFEEIFNHQGSEKLKRADAGMDEAVFRPSAGAENAGVPEEEEEEKNENENDDNMPDKVAALEAPPA